MSVRHRRLYKCYEMYMVGIDFLNNPCVLYLYVENLCYKCHLCGIGDLQNSSLCFFWGVCRVVSGAVIRGGWPFEWMALPSLAILPSRVPWETFQWGGLV